MLEDTFEAFLGVTEYLIDTQVCVGAGYAACYQILKNIFDDIDISLKYETLYDAKTRLKELFDMLATVVGVLKYEDIKEETSTTKFNISNVYQIKPEGDKILIGTGKAALKIDAEQKAAEEALRNMARKGYIKQPPNIYAIFSGDKKVEETTVNDIIRLCGAVDNINNLFSTKGKSKYQSKYQSTLLTQYIRKSDLPGVKACLELGADPNILDTEGMSAVDSLLIGATRKQFVKAVFAEMLKVGVVVAEVTHLKNPPFVNPFSVFVQFNFMP